MNLLGLGVIMRQLLVAFWKFGRNYKVSRKKLWLIALLALLISLTSIIHRSNAKASGNNRSYFPIVTQPDDEFWSFRYEVDNGIYVPRYIVKLSDSSFIIAGNYEDFSDGTNGWVMKVNGDGTVIWNKSFDINEPNWNSYLNHAISTDDGGVLIFGYLETVSDVADGWILKLDSDGVTEWEKRFSFGERIRFLSAISANNGDIVVAGSATTLPDYDGQVIVMRLTSSGNIVWQNQYGGDEGEVANSIAQTADGGFIVAGGISPNNNYPDILVLKLSSSGAVEWQKSYNSGGQDIATHIIQTSPGGYLVAGNMMPVIGGGRGIALLKLTVDGAISWQRFFSIGPLPEVTSLLQTTDGSYLIGGISSIANTNQVLKIDQNGHLVWSKGYDNGFSTQLELIGVELLEATPGQYLVAAARPGDVNGLPDPYFHLAMVNSSGEVPGCNDFVAQGAMLVNITINSTNTTIPMGGLSAVLQSEAAFKQDLSNQNSIFCTP